MNDIQKDFSQYNLAKLAKIAKYSYERYRLEAGDKKIFRKLCYDYGQYICSVFGNFIQSS